MSLIAKLTGKARKSGALIIVRSARTTAALILREMSSTYGRTPGGYIWAVLEPIGMIMILSLAFSLVVRAPSMGVSFILFYATGYLPFQLYSETEGKISRALQYSRSLLSYPSVLWIDAIAARFILNTITAAVVFCIIMGGIIIFEETRVSINIFQIVSSLGLAAGLGLGVGMVNCILRSLYPVWSNVWSIVSRPLFIASGVLFIYEDMPQSVQNVLWWNPLIHITGLMRAGFYSTYNPTYISFTYVCSIFMTLIFFGLVFMKRNYQKILEK
ncbi:ABC transporter permease [Loktanella salsilacus]|uniref:ABC transporter permease n=1 Tax=Loktanella salsilacus TaxID=195913 RepID=UPI003002415B